MAATKFLLCFLCLITFDGSRNFERDYLNEYPESHQRIVAAAQKEIGTREGRIPNTGIKISEYLRYTGIKFPAPWCAAWVSFVFNQAGYSVPKTAWSPGLFPAKRLVKAPKPGIVLGIYFTSLKRVAHCGIVESVKDSWVFSIEGNTNLRGSREGNGVYRRMRHIRSVHCFADWSK